MEGPGEPAQRLHLQHRDRLAKHGVFVIPTLSVLYSARGRPDGPELLKAPDTMKYVKPQFRPLLDMALTSANLSCDAAPRAIRQLLAAEVPVLAGTDTPAPGLTSSWCVTTLR